MSFEKLKITFSVKGIEDGFVRSDFFVENSNPVIGHS